MIRKIARNAAGAFALAVLGGCATQQVASSPSGGTMGGAAFGPVLTVERFLQASSLMDLGTMAALFGTHEGPMRDSRENLELRMNAIATALEHDDYRLGAESQVPGRTYPTRRVGVDLIRGTRTFEDVGFLVVETRDGSWVIEEIGLDQVTGR